MFHLHCGDDRLKPTADVVPKQRSSRRYSKARMNLRLASFDDFKVRQEIEEKDEQDSSVGSSKANPSALYSVDPETLISYDAPLPVMP